MILECCDNYRFTKDQIRVRLGEYDFEDTDNDEQTYSLAWMKMHENYDGKTFENDIAILKLNQNVRFTKSVQPACLPPPGNMDYTNVKATVTGWGTIYFGGPTSNSLQEVDVGIWTNQECATNYNRLGRKVLDTMLCAGDRLGGKDACQVRKFGIFAYFFFFFHFGTCFWNIFY